MEIVCGERQEELVRGVWDLASGGVDGLAVVRVLKFPASGAL